MLQFSIKSIQFGQSWVRIVCQNANGPCPLVALCNVLLLRGAIDLPPGKEVDSTYLQHQVVNYILDQNADRNRQHYMDEIIQLVQSGRLLEGLDVNLNFKAPDSFEYTLELGIFDLCGVRLLHGWIPDAQRPYSSKLQTLSYNAVTSAVVSLLEEDEAGHVRSLKESISSRMSGSERSKAGESAAAEPPQAPETTYTQAELHSFAQFLEDTSSQLTIEGIFRLSEMMSSGEIAVLFRNNHFGTLYKHPQLGVFLLMTDEGYKEEEGVAWEKLDNEQGDTVFYTGQFRPFEEYRAREAERMDELARQMQEAELAATEPPVETGERQVQSDYALALRLQQEYHQPVGGWSNVEALGRQQSPAAAPASLGRAQLEAQGHAVPAGAREREHGRPCAIM